MDPERLRHLQPCKFPQPDCMKIIRFGREPFFEHGNWARDLQNSLASYIMLQQYHIPTEDLEGGAILDCRLLNLSVAGCSITSTPVQVLKPANKALPINVAAAEISQIWAL